VTLVISLRMMLAYYKTWAQGLPSGALSKIELRLLHQGRAQGVPPVLLCSPSSFTYRQSDQQRDPGWKTEFF